VTTARALWPSVFGDEKPSCDSSLLLDGRRRRYSSGRRSVSVAAVALEGTRRALLALIWGLRRPRPNDTHCYACAIPRGPAAAATAGGSSRHHAQLPRSVRP